MHRQQDTCLVKKLLIYLNKSIGKGIYFTDIVSKSTNYCHATKDNPYGLLLVCEVALGKFYLLNINQKRKFV